MKSSLKIKSSNEDKEEYNDHNIYDPIWRFFFFCFVLFKKKNKYLNLN